MIIHDVAQRSAEWRQLRLGCLTSSCVDEMLATTQKGEFTSQRRNLMVRLVLERLTGRSNERTFQSQAMLDGQQREDDALSAFEQLTGRLLRPFGFIAHDSLKAGCSPDGVLGDFEAYVEAKAPIPATHLGYLETGKVPLDYERQILHGCWITGCPRWVFISYNPDFPERGRLKVVDGRTNPEAIERHDKQVRAFLAEVDAKEQALRTMLDVQGTLAASLGAA